MVIGISLPTHAASSRLITRDQTNQSRVEQSQQIWPITTDWAIWPIRAE